MGINGLLPFLKNVTRSVSLKEYSGCSVAVDSMSWLHRGIMSEDVRSMSNAQFKETSNESMDHRQSQATKDNLEKEIICSPQLLQLVKKIDFDF